MIIQDNLTERSGLRRNPSGSEKLVGSIIIFIRLSSVNVVKKNGRGAQSDTKSSLADVLSKALGDKNENNKQKNTKKQDKLESKKTEKNNKKEVPEDILKNILK